MSEEKKLAVLIDSDNVSAKYAQFVMNEVQKYGVPTYKRVYGDWEKGGNGWHAPAVNYSIMPVQQTSYVAGKNATDFSMIIDAMDILYTGNVDGFVLVTSDSDFTRLAIRLREAGKLVVGIGELKTPRPFTVSCHHFCYLNQIGEMEASCDEPAIRKAVLTFVTDNKDERLDLARISAVLTSKFGNINFDELGRIIEDQIARHTDAIIICGTTGECSTMTDEEQLAAIKFAVDTVNHRVPVIAGAGSNDTDHGCALAAKSAACGADALLMVTPYYNKTSQAGLVAHFTAMAEAGGIPVILYNVPSRTGLNIAPETALELSKHPLINGIKEASGNISQVAKVAALCGDALNIYSGNDDQVVPLLALGGKGVISVVSNVAPELVHNCCQAFFDGDTAKACALQLEMLPLEEALFCEVNPIPVKYAMNVLGWNAGECRLPLVEPSDAHKAKIEQALQAAGLIKE